MDKRKLHHLWTKFRLLNYRYFAVAFALSGTIAIFALRHNNLEMLRLRQDITIADENGAGVESALQALRQHVYTHMNTDLTSGGAGIRPPIQLSKTYERLVSAERGRVAAINNNVSSDAVAVCEARFPVGQLTGGRVQCVQDYVLQNGVHEQPITKELYQFDFVSPFWAPDLAGWSLAAAAIFFVLFVFRFGLEKWFQKRLR